MCREELMTNVNKDYKKNAKAFWKFVNSHIKSNGKSRIEALNDGRGNCVSNHEGKLKILKSHNEKLGSELHNKTFNDSWKDEVCKSIKSFENLSLENSHFTEMLDQKITTAEVSHAIRTIKNNKSAGADGIVGELIKYGGNVMCDMLVTLFNLEWHSEFVPCFQLESLIVYLRRKIGMMLVIIEV